MKNFSVVSILFSETHSICEYESTSIGGQSGVITVDEFTRQILQVKDFLKGELVHSIRNVISEESQGIEKRILENISKNWIEMSVHHWNWKVQIFQNGIHV